MPTGIIPALAVVLSIGAPLLQAAEREIQRGALPPAVEKTVVAQSQGATIRKFIADRENGKPVYEVEMVFNGHSKDVEIAADGSLNEIEEEVAYDSLPGAVKAGLETRAAGAKITKVESLTKHGKLVAYEAATLKGPKKGEIQVGPDGSRLTHEE